MKPRRGWWLFALGIFAGAAALACIDVPTPEDSDADGLPDAWEMQHFGDLGETGTDDNDGDGLNNFQEQDAGTNPMEPDTDGDGLPDAWEYFHGLNGAVGDAYGDPDHDGLANLREHELGTDPQNPDSDWDAVSDGREMQEGTDPADFESYNPRRLAWFRFEEENLAGAAGDLPRTATGIERVAGWRGKGARINETGDLLAYGRVRADGASNIALKRGTVRFWFKPEWATAQMSGYWSRFLQLGWWTPDSSLAMWFLYLSEVEPRIYFGEKNGDGNPGLSLSGPVGWAASQWVQVVLTYTPTTKRIYLNGTQVAVLGHADFFDPDLGDLDDSGLMFGSDGGQPVRGTMDEVELFNYEMSAAEIAADYAAQTALGADTNDNGLPDSWETENLGNLEQSAEGDADHDGLTNRDEYERGLDPKNSDTDWDGNSDLQELADGTDPADFDSFTPRRIARFALDGPGFVQPGGEEPRAAAGLEQAAGWKGYGVRINETGDLLAYERLRPEGGPNIALKRGSVRLWFKPSWASHQNPDSWSRFVQLGWWTPDRSHALWMLMFQHEADNLIFGQNSGNPASYNDFYSGIGAGWAANAWHQLVMTYSSTSRKIYLDGILVGGQGGNVDLAFNLEQLDATGIMLGTDSAQPIKGIVDEVEFFNHELSGSQIQSDYNAAIASRVDADSNGLPDAWEIEHFGSTGQAPEEDEEGDGVLNNQEALFGTNPTVADTDGDGRSDAQEIAQGTDPLTPDSAPGTSLQAPANVVLTPLEDGKCQIEWTNPGPTPTLNIIMRTINGRDWKTIGVVPGTQHSFTDETGVPEEDLLYFYRVFAYR